MEPTLSLIALDLAGLCPCKKTEPKRLHSQNSIVWLRFLEKAHDFFRGDKKRERSAGLGIQNEQIGPIIRRTRFYASS
jgi:hypothetical protein